MGLDWRCERFYLEEHTDDFAESGSKGDYGLLACGVVTDVDLSARVRATSSIEPQ